MNIGSLIFLPIDVALLELDWSVHIDLSRWYVDVEVF